MPPSDPDPVLQALLREERYVRGLAREIAGESAGEDVAQQAWVQALRHGGRDVGQPRSWLGRIVRNVAANFARGESRRRVHEGARAESRMAPSSAELMEREERRRALVACVDKLAGASRDVVWLRYFEGMPPRRIASRLGLSVDQVQGLHRRAMERMRRELDEFAAGEGLSGRRAFLLPLIVTGAPPPPTTPWIPTAAIPGALLMSTKSKVVAVAAVVLGIAAFVAWPPGDAPPSTPGDSGEPARIEAARGGVEDDDTDDEADVYAVESERTSVGSSASSEEVETATLRVRAFHEFGGTRAPADGVTVFVGRRGADHADAIRARTDATGSAKFTGLAAGAFLVWGDREGRWRRVKTELAQTSEVELVFTGGSTLRGVVVDDSDQPVAGASIEVASPGLVGSDPAFAAVTDEEGRFEVLSSPDPCVVCARASGYVASPMQLAWSEGREAIEVRIQLANAGGVVAGTVFDPSGEPVSNARVKVGAGRLQGLHPEPDRPETLPALTFTNDDGRFRAVGLAAGEHPIEVRAVGFGPWSSVVDVGALSTTEVRVDLSAGASLSGVVRDGAGNPVADATVEFGTWGEFTRRSTRSEKDGAYELRGLPDGEVELHAEHGDYGEVDASVVLKPESAAELDLRLNRGQVLRGRVTDVAGHPVSRVFIEATAEKTRDAEHWLGFVRTDEDGRYELVNCPTDRPLRVDFGGSAIEPHRVEDVLASVGTLDVQVRRVAAATAKIRGTIVGPDGRPVAGARVSPWHAARGTGPGPVTTGDDGAFSFAALNGGKWRVHVYSPDHPDPSPLTRILGDGEDWNLGIVQLAVGGRLRLRIADDAREGLRCMIAADATSQRWLVRTTEDRPKSAILAAGTYRALVWGPRVAARSMPFSISAGVYSEIEVEASSGIVQRFVFELEDSTASSTGATLTIARDGARVVDQWLPYRGEKPWFYEVALQPGAYRVGVGGSKRGSAEIVVGADRPRTTTVTLR